MQKTTAIVLIFAAIVAGAVGTYILTHRNVQVAGISAPAGSTYSTQKIAEQNLVVSSSTVYSMLNTDATDRLIEGASVHMENGNSTTTQYAMSCATSTSPYWLNGNTNYTFNSVLSTTTVGTTTGTGFWMSTTSPGLMGNGNALGTTTRVWNTNTYMVCTTATQWGSNSNLLDSAVTGYVKFPYAAQ